MQNTKYALITGGSSGIGRAYAFLLAERGYHILIVSNDDAGNRRTASEISAKCGVQTRSLLLDLTCTESVAAITGYLAKEALLIEVFICNAGMLSFGSFCGTPAQSLERIIDLHCKIPTLLCRELALLMRKNGKGYILIMSSATAWMPYPTIAAYSATKGYLKNLAQALYYELRNEQIGVTAVFPGAIDTPFYTLDNRMRHRLLRWHIMLPADYMARKALRALFKRRPRYIPGLFTKLCAGLCAMLPVRALLPVLKLRRVRRLFAIPDTTA